jgi:hypothetical protein
LTCPFCDDILTDLPITNQLSLGAENLMEDNKYLLECDLSTLAAPNGKQQAYLLLAIKATGEASLILAQAKQSHHNMGK